MADNTLQVRLQSAYKTETEWQATTTIPKVGEILYTKTGPHDGWYKVGNGTSFWSDLEYIKPSYNYNEIQPVKSNTYSGIYGSENNFANATFYFGSVKPDAWTTTWRIKYRIYSIIPNQTNYTGWFDVEMWGNQAVRLGYRFFNYHYSTSYRSLYYHVLYSLTSTGFNNNYGHLLGIGLRNAQNATSSSYPRTFKIDIIEEENCEFTFFDTATKYASVPGTGATNYNGYSEWEAYNNGLKETGDDNDTTTLQYSTARLTAGSNGLPAYSIIMMKTDGTWEGLTTGNATTATTSPKNTSGFVLGQMYLYWSGTNLSASGLTATSTIRTAQDWTDMRYTLNCGTSLTSNQMVYLKGTVVNGLFYLADGIYTQTLPTTADNFVYIPIGMCYGNGYAISFWGYHGAYYHDGTNIREYITNEASQTKSGLMSFTDKKKLDGIAEGANKYVLPVATSGAIGGVKSGTDIAVDANGNVSVVDNSHNHTIANVTNLQTTLDGKAPLASPEFTGTPKAPTAASGTNSTQIATTAFVQNVVNTNMDVGGRNLLKQSDFAVNNLGVPSNVKVQVIEDTTSPCGIVIRVYSNNITTNSYVYLGQMRSRGRMINGETYVASVWMKASKDSQMIPNPDMECHSSKKILENNTLTTVWQRYSIRFVYSSSTTYQAWYFICRQKWTDFGEGEYIDIGGVKLEKGLFPTDWTPAPEDLVSSLSLSGSTLAYENPLGTQLGSMSLTKSTVGLGNVDNTSDANKPISAATQNALDKLSAKVGNAKQFTGTCSSAADATAKVVTCTAFTADDLVKGTRISVYFDNTNSGAVGSLTLNVNSTGAKSIKHIYNGSYNNIPGAGYIKAGQIYNFTYDGTYWVVDMMYNSNTYPEYLSYRNNTYAKKAIAANRWIVGDKDGYEEIASGVTFDLSYPILYTSGAVSQGSSNYANMFMQYYDLNLGNLKSGFTSSAKKMIYLVVTISGNTATVDSSIITDTLPTSDDGKAYITLGRLGNQSTGANYFLFQAVHPIFVYRKGQIRLYSGSADVVNGHTVEADVPSGAVFTDTKVTQTLSSTNANYPLILGKNTTSITTNYTDTVLRNNSIYANPSTGAITATKFIGSLQGNADTATSATTATTAAKLGTSNVGTAYRPIYLSAGSPTALSNDVVLAIPVASNAQDANTKYDTGVYNFTGGTFTNGPTTHSYGQLFTMAYRKPHDNGTPDYAAQIYMHYNANTTKNTMYYRTSSQSAWNAWQQVAHAAPQTALGSVTQPIYMESDGTLKVASQVAELDSNGLILSSQLPSYVDDVIEAYYYNSKMYKEAAHTNQLTGESSKIYVDLSTNKTYRWSGSAYVEISASLALGENSSTAYRGDRGKIAYDHSQTTSGNPHNVTKTDIGLSNVENKSSATIRGELTSSNVTTALGYTPVPNTRQINGKALTDNIVLDYSDISPIGGGIKTYAGLYGSANDAAGASFYFASVKPDNYYGIWKVKYRIKVDVPNQNYYHGYADVEIYGNTNTYTAYSIFNSHLSTSYRTFYFHNLYRATETGSSAYGHLLGIGLRASANPTSSSYPRTVRVEMLEAENCTVTMFDDVKKYANVPGTGSTNYVGLSEFDGYSNGLRETGDDNDTYTVRDYYTRLTAGTNGMKQYSLVMQDASGTWQSFTTDHGADATKTKNTIGFQLGKIYYMSMSGNVASGAQCGDNIVTSHAISIDLRYSTNCASTLTAYKPIYIKGTFDVSTGLFYLADTWWTEELPDHPDGFIYKQIGFTRSAYYIDFSNTLPTYWYHDGAIREFVMPTATPFVAGLLSSGDKIKLDTIETGANKCIALTYAEIDAILAT